MPFLGAPSPRQTSIGEDIKSARLRCCVFDLLELDRPDLRPLPLLARWKQPGKLLRGARYADSNVTADGMVQQGIPP
jgi:ATP-dependent DNA ligase